MTQDYYFSVSHMVFRISHDGDVSDLRSLLKQKATEGHAACQERKRKFGEGMRILTDFRPKGTEVQVEEHQDFNWTEFDVVAADIIHNPNAVMFNINGFNLNSDWFFDTDGVYIEPKEITLSDLSAGNFLEVAGTKGTGVANVWLNLNEPVNPGFWVLNGRRWCV